METYQVKEIKASDLNVGDEVWGINEGDPTYKWRKVTLEAYQYIQNNKNSPDFMMLVKIPSVNTGKLSLDEEGYKIIKDLAKWHDTYPKSRSYSRETIDNIDKQLFSIEERAVDFINKNETK